MSRQLSACRLENGIAGFAARSVSTLSVDQRSKRLRKSASSGLSWCMNFSIVSSDIRRRSSTMRQRLSVAGGSRRPIMPMHFGANTENPSGTKLRLDAADHAISARISAVDHASQSVPVIATHRVVEFVDCKRR